MPPAQINVRDLQQQYVRALKTQGSCLIKKDSKRTFQGRIAVVDTKFENLQYPFLDSVLKSSDNTNSCMQKEWDAVWQEIQSLLEKCPNTGFFVIRIIPHLD